MEKREEERQTKLSEGQLDSENFVLRGNLIGKITVDCNGIPLEMVKIKAGTFTMGSPEDETGRHHDEKLHRVTLSQDYWLGKFEVTQAQW